MVMEVITTGEAEAYVYEGMTYSATGTPMASRNRNRNSANAPLTVVYEDPTVSTTGNLLWAMLSGSGNNGSGADRSANEWLLAPGEYLYRITSRSASCKVLVRFEWYEDLGV
jgi:hypothetical protein